MRLRLVPLMGSVSSILCVQAAILVLWAAAPAGATIMYQYTGQPYTTASAPFNTTMSIHGTITVPTLILTNLNIEDITSMITSYSFTDGVTSYNPGNSIINFAKVATQSDGTIVIWDVGMSDSPKNNDVFRISMIPGTIGDVAVNPTGIGKTSIPGSWSVVPEPTTLTLSAIGLSVLSAATRRRWA